MKRRDFLASSIGAGVAVGVGTRIARAGATKTKREYYELRVYRTPTAAKRKIAEEYLANGLLPALNRMGIGRVGVFTRLDDDKDFSVYALIPYRTLELFAMVNPRLGSDGAYQKAARGFFSSPQSDPVYRRIESYFMKAFTSIPVIELPPQTGSKQPRIFELRIYESHSGDTAARKVEMFDTGETQLMRDVELGPVFFGETLIGSNVPNLTYMLAAPDMEAHKKHWTAFVKHPEWERMKNIEKYKDTVSKVTNWFLEPTGFSQI